MVYNMIGPFFYTNMVPPGNLIAALPAVPYGKPFYRGLEVTKILALKNIMKF